MFAKIMEWLKNLTLVPELFKTLAEKGKEVLAGLSSAFTDYLKRTWALWAVIIATVFVYGVKLAPFKQILYLLAPVAAILLVVERILDAKAGWGLFPGLDLDEAFKRAIATPLSCALVILGLCAVMVSILICAALVITP